MDHMTRRQLLALSLSAPASWLLARRAWAGQDLSRFMTGPPPCSGSRELTPATGDPGEFRPGSPARASLLEPGLSGTKLVLTGSVIGLKCGVVKDAVLDFWQADANGRYDATGLRLRGHQPVDANGHYRLETIVPGPVPPRARHLNVRVQPPGKPAFVTQLFFPNDPGNARDKAFQATLVMTVTTTKDGSTATFDFVLDL